jgi:predicted RNase H-like nuclease (RuvC/YqgF family)
MRPEIDSDLEAQIYRDNINYLQKQLQESYKKNLELRTKLSELEPIIKLNKYYIKVVSSLFQHEATSLVVYAYSEEQLKEVFKEYEIISCTNVDNITEQEEIIDDTLSTDA